MSAWNGRPVLARMTPGEIPAVDARTALDGLTAGFLAAVAYAGHHTGAGELQFMTALRDARGGHDYAYSHQFLAGVELAKAALADILGGRS